MEESKNTELNDQQVTDQNATETAPVANTQPEDNGSASGKEKTFTQEDVNRIVSERLSRDRSRIDSARQAELDEREKSISNRENLMECKEFISKTGYPELFLTYFDTTDSKKFQEEATRLVTTFPQVLPVQKAWSQDHGAAPDLRIDISDAFKPNY